MYPWTAQSRRGGLVSAIFVVFVIGFSQPVWGQSFDELTDDQKVQLIELLGAGNQSFDAGDYEQACEHYEQAGEIADFSEVYYRLALCRERLDQPGRAIEAYETYLQLDPEVADRGRIEAEIDRLHGVEEARRIARLTVESAPPGAQVMTADGQELGTTPLELELTPGSHELIFSAPGHFEEQRSVELSPGGSTEMRVELTAIGRLRVISDPEGSEVRLDGPEGEKLGTTPMEVELEPGDYQVVLTREDFPPQARQVTVERGRAIDLDVTMVREEVSGGWLTVAGWTSLGLAAATGAATAGLWYATESRIAAANNYDRRDENNSREELDEMHQTIHRMEIATRVTGVSTATLVVLGGSFFWLGSRRGDGDSAAQLQLHPYHGGAYATFSLRF